MNTAIRCIVFLACTTICASAAIKGCRCVRTSKFVSPSVIAYVTEYGPRPYCNKQEVIVILKDGSSQCLDPGQKFTQAVLESKQSQMAAHAAKMNGTVSKTTTAPATAAPISS